MEKLDVNNKKSCQKMNKNCYRINWKKEFLYLDGSLENQQAPFFQELTTIHNIFDYLIISLVIYNSFLPTHPIVSEFNSYTFNESTFLGSFLRFQLEHLVPLGILKTLFKNFHLSRMLRKTVFSFIINVSCLYTNISH